MCSNMKYPTIYILIRLIYCRYFAPGLRALWSKMFRENFTVPPGVSASLSIIDTTGRVAGCAVDSLLQPPMDGFEMLPTFPSWAFLVESQHGRNILFDLGIPRDWPELPPSVSDDLKSSGWTITVPKSTAEILEQNDVAVGSIDAVVWRLVYPKFRGRPSCQFFELELTVYYY